MGEKAESKLAEKQKRVYGPPPQAGMQPYFVSYITGTDYTFPQADPPSIDMLHHPRTGVRQLTNLSPPHNLLPTAKEPLLEKGIFKVFYFACDLR